MQCAKWQNKESKGRLMGRCEQGLEHFDFLDADCTASAQNGIRKGIKDYGLVFVSNFGLGSQN